ncbi:hypothetical protein Cob_v000385 [Colletotrichum orbiculare MAFF 240422]|uniref:Uncharacterized protein n=1 Tax=Colletotrichum orbiculare (strain 104-T / ATCC 96160 / CBS 514.97 / LARS 414 / MAFF 240422) TaxID=1213857 RepID=A0A484GB21_COLOR|nr:hypothetical protein Cob_v000385 [Colletotrichum orbiculare MAFF 240422]
MHFQTTTFFLAAAVIFQGVSAQFCTGPPPDCNFEDCRTTYADPWAICKEKCTPNSGRDAAVSCCSGRLYCPA